MNTNIDQKVIDTEIDGRMESTKDKLSQFLTEKNLTLIGANVNLLTRIGSTVGLEPYHKYDFQLEQLVNLIEKEDLKMIKSLIQDMRDILLPYPSDELRRTNEFKVENADKIKDLLNQIGQIIAKYFKFTDEDSKELDKGTCYDNILGYWNRYRDPNKKDDNTYIRGFDCKLPTLVTLFLLQEQAILMRVRIRYTYDYVNFSTRNFSNFAAHPYIEFTANNKTAKTPDLKEPQSVLLHFGTNGAAAYINREEIYTGSLGYFDNMRSVPLKLDLFFFAGILVRQLKINNKYAQLDANDILNLIKDIMYGADEVPKYLADFFNNNLHSFISDHIRMAVPEE